MNKENKEGDIMMKEVTANLGENIYHFADRLTKMRSKGEVISAKFNGVIFTVPEDGSVLNEYFKAEMEHSEAIERKYKENRVKARQEAGENITKACKEFVEKYAGRTDIDESEIMKLLSEIGEKNFHDDFLDIDSSVSEQLIQLLEQNGYKSKASNEQYRIGKNSYDGGQKNFVVVNSFIVCKNGEDLTQFDASQLAKFTIENAMSQIALGRPYYANSDLAYMYGKMKEEEKIKEALSYSMAADLHEAWRASRKQEDGTYEPRMKKSKDEKWNAEHGTDDVDIANLSFEQLPSNWQYENLEAARVAIEQVYSEVKSNQIMFRTEEKIEEMASKVHEAWLSRNDWVYDKEYGNPDQAKPYAELSEEEKAKDRVQIQEAIAKVKAYDRGEIDIDELSKQFGLDKTVIDPEFTPAQLAEDEEAIKASEEFDRWVRDDSLGQDEKSLDDAESR